MEQTQNTKTDINAFQHLAYEKLGISNKWEEMDFSKVGVEKNRSAMCKNKLS